MPADAGRGRKETMHATIRSAYEKVKSRDSLRRAEFEALPEEGKKIERGRRNFVIDNISIYIISSICAGSYLAGLLKYAGVPAEINGLILAIPVLAAAFQIVGAALSQRLNAQKAFVVTGIAIQRVCMSVIFIYPLLFGPGAATAALIIVTYAAAFIAGTAAGPSASNWLVSLVPARLRARYFSMRERLSLLFVAAAMVSVSPVLDRFKQAGSIVTGFAVVGFFLLAVSIVDIVYVAQTYEPASGLAKGRFTFQSILEPLRDKAFARVIVVLILWQISAQICIPYLGLYFIDNIGISYTAIGVVAFAVTIEKALIVNVWGRFADRTSWGHVIKIAILIFAASQILFIFLTRGNAGWFYPAAAVVANVAWSVLNIAFFNFQFHFVNPARSTAYIGVSGAISGTSGFLAALAGSFLLGAVNRSGFPFGGQRVLLLISGLMSGALVLYMHRRFPRQEAAKEDNAAGRE